MNIYEANTNDNSTNNNYFINPANIFHFVNLLSYTYTLIYKILLNNLARNKSKMKYKLKERFVTPEQKAVNIGLNEFKEQPLFLNVDEEEYYRCRSWIFMVE